MQITREDEGTMTQDSQQLLANVTKNATTSLVY
jgi:Asp-tRNA(Asn)/Glu-tRNA(Gln) amidotransferase C subunit